MSSFRQTKEKIDNMPTRFYSSRQEKNIENAIGGKVTKNSGATMFQKGDILAGDFLIEAKTCVKDKKSFTIQKDWIEKNKNESLFMNKKYSAIAFNFGPSSKENYYVIDEQTFVLLKDALSKLEE